MNLIKAIPYVGSKARLLPIIASNLPSDMSVYCEPFSGGFSLGLNLLKYGYLDNCNIVYNDLDTELVSYFKYIRDDYISLVDDIEFLKGKINIELIKERKDHEQVLKDIRDMYVTSVRLNSALYYIIKKANRGMNIQKIYKPLNFSTSSLYDKYYMIGSMLQKIDIRNLDFGDLISLDSENTFWYLDPPYYEYANNRFYAQCSNELNEFKHTKLFEFITKLKGKFIMSYNDCDYIKSLYTNYELLNIDVYSSLNLNKGFSEELLISNFKLDIKDDSISSLCRSNMSNNYTIVNLRKQGNNGNLRGVNSEIFDFSFDELFSE